MDIVDLEEMGLIDGSSEFTTAIPDSPQIIYSQDGAIHLNPEELATYGDRVTVVTLPNLVQILQDGTTQNIGYLINDNQIPELNRSVVISQDNFVEPNESISSAQFGPDELQKHLCHFLDSSAVTATNDDVINNKSSDFICPTKISTPAIEQQISELSAEILSSSVGALVSPGHCVNRSILHQKATSLDGLQKVSLVATQQDVISLCSDISKVQQPANKSSTIEQENSDLIVSTKSKSSGTDHVDPPDKTGPLYCEECNLHFPSWRLLRKHKWKHLHDKPYKCNFCHESFNYEMNLNLHLATHNVDKPYCPVCKKHFSRIASLKAHIMLHKREESVFCNVCGDEFNSLKHLLEHVNPQNKIRVEKKAFKCNLCDRVFEKFVERKNHLIKAHKVLQNKKVKKFKRRKGGNNQCDFCQKHFDKPSQLLRHKRIHTGERPYKCELCASAFSQKGTLRIHMLKHTRERPYICPYCKGTFSQKGNLQAHVKRLHKGPDGNERIYKCHLCSCLFRKLGNLNTHFTKVHSFYTPIEGELSSDKYEMRVENQCTDSSSDTSNKENQKEMYCEISKRDERQGILTLTTYMKDGTVEEHNVYQRRMKSLSCSYCSKEFRRPGDLVRHVRTHTQEKPFKCNLCCKSFALQSTLGLHLQTHSGGKRYSCSTCNKCYSTIRSLKIHKKKHMREISSYQDVKEPLKNILESETIYKTDQVPQEVGVECLNLVSLDQVDLSSLSSNIILTENGNIVDLSSDVEESENKTGYLYKCAECNMIFEKLVHLTVHMKTHRALTYTCEDCSCSFNSKNALQSHTLDEHTPSKFVCDCGGTFPSEIALLEHKETHEAGFPWTCPMCGWAFRSYSACKKHITSMHTKMNMVKLKPVRLLEKHNDKQQKDQTQEKIPSQEVTSSNNGNEEVHTDLRDFIRNLQPNQLYITVQGTGASFPLYQDNNIVNTNSPTPGNSQKQLFENPLEACIFLQTADDVNPSISTDMASILPQAETINRCDTCNLVFTNIADFSLHKASHILEKPNTCLTCEESFSSVIEYEEHLKLHVDNSVSNNIDGSLESQGFINQTQSENTLFSDLTEHQAIVHVHEPEKYNCAICNDSFDSCEDMKAHESSHFQQVRIQCNLCEQEFENKEEFRNHGQKYHISPKSITEKKKSRSNWRPLARQLTEEETKALSNIEPDNATISEKVFLQSILEKERYENPVKEEPKPVEIHRHRCKYCPKSFRKQSDLIRHIRIHTGERPYQCTSCNKRFSIKSTASSHMNTHSKDKPFECYICAKRFATTGSLKIHMRLHTGLKPFSCTMCDAKFRTSGHKKAHVLKHLKGTLEKSDKKKKGSNREINVLDSIEENDVTNSLPNALTSTEALEIPDDSPCVKIAEGSEYLVPLKPQNSSYRQLSFAKDSEYLTSLKITNSEEEGQGNMNKSPKFLLSINDEGGADGETPRYLLAIKDGGTGEDDFIVETISEEEIIVTITKGSDSNVSKITNQESPSQHINIVDSFNCTFCGKIFDKKLLLERHIKRDHSQEIFQCTVCLEKFERKPDLDLHILVHELDRGFSCPECAESFSLEEELRAHKCVKTASLDLSLDHDLFLFPHV